MTISRNCIIISPYFPPSSLAGVHRARHLAKHLPGSRWHPIVICVDEAFHEERLDPELASLVPPDVEVIKVGALPRQICRALGFGDLSVRAWQHLRRAVFRVLDARKIDVVLITGSPYYPMVLAEEIRRRTGVPVVLDFQDPWVSSWGAIQPRWSKAGVAHWLAETLEPKAVRAASYITSVSETQNDQMVERYQWLDRSRMAAIPIGCDPDDFDAMRRSGSADGTRLVRQQEITLSYVGTFMPRSERLMRALLSAFARVRGQHPEPMSKVRLLFVGTSNQPNDSTTFRVRPIAEFYGIDDVVREIPERVPYLRAIRVLAESHGVLLIGSDERHYTASKIYPALMAGRPFISLFHRDSSAHEILTRSGGGLPFCFEDVSELDALEDSLGQGILRLAANDKTIGRADPKAYLMFSASEIARRFAAVFEALVEERGRLR